MLHVAMRATSILVCTALGSAMACGGTPAPAPQPPVSGPPGGTADPWTDPPASDPPPEAAPAEVPAAAHGMTESAALVEAHNRVRAKHCAAPLTWSPKLAAVAQTWAAHLRDSGCTFGHSGGNYGENLAAGTSGMMDPEAVVTMWYDEVKGYSFKQPGFSMQTGHFTQVVWRSTTQVGCGKVECKGNDIWVCEYDPPGNWEGQYREQVLPAGCR